MEARFQGQDSRGSFHVQRRHVSGDANDHLDSTSTSATKPAAPGLPEAGRGAASSDHLQADLAGVQDANDLQAPTQQNTPAAGCSPRQSPVRAMIARRVMPGSIWSFAQSSWRRLVSGREGSAAERRPELLPECGQITQVLPRSGVLLGLRRRRGRGAMPRVHPLACARHGPRTRARRRRVLDRRGDEDLRWTGQRGPRPDVHRDASHIGAVELVCTQALLAVPSLCAIPLPRAVPPAIALGDTLNGAALDLDAGSWT